jgi:hypothetical protein
VAGARSVLCVRTRATAPGSVPFNEREHRAFLVRQVIKRDNGQQLNGCCQFAAAAQRGVHGRGCGSDDQPRLRAKRLFARRTKTQVALCDGLPVSLCPRLPESTATD